MPQKPPHFSDGRTLIWCDESDCDGLSASGKWAYERELIRNNEAQFYPGRSDSVRVENGHLVIEARRVEWEGAAYTSASLHRSVIRF